jgi:peroxiredoxin
MASKTLKIGERAPLFHALPGTDGRRYSLDTFKEAKVLVVVFSCNHCPYVQAYEDRVMAFHREFGSKSVALVAINSNEIEHYPEDSFDEMVKRANKKGFKFPYLRDEDQSVATAYGATHTPEFFVFDHDRRLRYHGKFDDSWKDVSQVKSEYVRQAVEALLVEANVTTPETFSIGCTIKWKS